MPRSFPIARDCAKAKNKPTSRPPYADTEYNIQRKKFFATWNSSDERKKVLEGMDINEMKRRFGPKDDFDLHFLEVFAGQHLLYSAAKLYGLNAHGVDVTYSSKLNILTAFGFLVFLHNVNMANRLARRVAYLIEYQHRAGSFYVIENPSGSMLFEYPCIKVTLWGTAPFMEKLYEQLTGTRRNQLRRIQSFLKMDISRGYVDVNGRARRVGGKDLTKTAIYPGTLALKVAELLDEHFKTLIPRAIVDEMDMELEDTNDAASSDSGLEDLIGASSMQ
ncbi:unnamed protein product [Symbiodinium microadriaticum]|nr:unnamed protein product [Symbiodinium microadriaticum]